METDQGIHGIGEAYSCGPDEATVATINDFKRWLVGQDPRNIEHLWAMMINFTRFPGGLVVNAAISGIEHALWDIHGKAAGLPVYRLLGGKCRDKIRVYQSAGGDEPKAVAEHAQALVAEVRLHGGEDVAAHAQRQRPALQPGDPRGRPSAWPPCARPWGRTSISASISTPSSSRSRGPPAWPGPSSPIDPMWLEEPIRPENVAAMAKLADHVNIPLASGECNYTKHEFRTILAAQALDIIQPDICLCGGLLEMKKIAAMAEAHYVMVAPHNPMGPVATVGERALRGLHAQLPDPGVPPRRRSAAQGPAQGAADGEGRLHAAARQARARASS